MEKRWLSVLKTFRYAQEAAADVIVLPELAICPEIRLRISDWLNEHQHPFWMTLPGSFHQELDGAIFNYAELFSRSGKTMLSHHKLTKAGDADQPEGIITGRKIDLLITPIGLLGIPICLDFCQERPPFSQFWEQICPDWLLVPAFGDERSVDAHARRAATLQRIHGTVCTVANQHPKGIDEAHGFVCHSGQPKPKQPESKDKNCCIKVKLDL